MKTLYDTEAQAQAFADGCNLNEMMLEETEYRWTFLVEPFAKRYIVAAYDEKNIFTGYL